MTTATDIFFKANKRNLLLLEKHLAKRRESEALASAAVTVN